ncbi:hypothetical protein BDV93DRAFT_529173 [Ceratobasidium sp. AG-I]|nr:hypothetical protein BDV93DRAFT_529173 [Ceratobasidium sp. AG-I]
MQSPKPTHPISMVEAETITPPTTQIPVPPSTSTNSHTMLKPSQVFEIPELLGLISGFLTQGAACAFLKCSRACFHAAVGQVWEFVPGISRLFALLPGVRLSSNATIILPDLTECDFGRFHFYAAFIRRLRFFSSCDYPETVNDWNSLISYTQHKRLLPNLQHIIYFSGSTSQMSCLTVFLSSTLLSIRCWFANYSNVGIDRASTLLQSIQKICPGLEELSFHPVFKEGLVSSDGPILPVSRIYETCSELQNLRVLATTLNFYDRSVWLALARLPRLETLDVSDTCFNFALPPAITLPDDSFPSLRNLIVRKLYIKDMQYIWNIPQLVSKLLLVDVAVVSLKDEIDGDMVFSTICNHSPLIVDLCVKLNRYEQLSHNSFMWLEQLSLEKLSVGAFNFSQLEVTCEVLANACPLLRELRMPRTEISIFDLQHFAQLSRLQYLQVGVDWGLLGDLPGATPEPSYISHVFHQWEGNRAVYQLAAPAQVQRAILYLLSFWPELESIKALITTAEYPNNPSSALVNQTLKAEQDARRFGGGGYHAGVPEAHSNALPIGFPANNP